MSPKETLQKLAQDNPALIFENKGYENLPADVVAAHADAIAEIEAILKANIRHFVQFQNFKTRDNGTLAVRYQVYYDDALSFKGVAYTPLEAF